MERVKRFSIVLLLLWSCVLSYPGFRKLESYEEIDCIHGEVKNDKCECFTGYVGSACDIKCPGFDEESDDDVTVCNGNGKCILSPDNNEEAICECSNDLFQGPECKPICPGTRMDNDVLIQCSAHGSCESNACKCSFGYYGDDCNSSCPGLVMVDSVLKECNGNGQCNSATLKCTCNEGDFDPLTCGGKCESTETCNRHGLCNLSGTCDCIEGWSGPYCNTECSRETCNGHGECVDGICICDSNYRGDLCETRESSASLFIVILIILNVITAYFWYKQTHKTIFEHKLLPAQFNPEQLAIRRQREIEQVQSLTRASSNPTPAMPTVVATVNKPTDHWVCPACTFKNPGTASVCIVCNTAKGAVIEKPKTEDLLSSDEEEVSIKRTRKTTQRAARSGRSGHKPSTPKTEEKVEIPSNLELLSVDTTEQETELFKNDHIRICMIMKRFDDNPKLFNILYRFYSVKDPLSNVDLTTSAPKYIQMNAHPISSTSIESEHPATQQLVLLLTEDKPIKIRVSGKVTVNGEEVAIQTGGLSIM